MKLTLECFILGFLLGLIAIASLKNIWRDDD